MKKSLWFGWAAVLTAAVLVPGVRGAKDEVIPSAWAASPPAIDGVSKDWEGMTPAVWEKGDVDYAFRNDAENLYILFVFKNPKFRSTVEQLGMNIYLNTQGKKSKNYALLFVKKQMSAEEAIAYIDRQTPLSEDQKIQMRAKNAYNVYYYQVTNKDAKSKDIPPGVLPKTALFKYAPVEKSLVYEFSIPLARIHELAAGVEAEPGKTVTVGFEWGGPTEAQRKQAARAAGDTGIANEQITRGGEIESMTGPGRGRIPPKYSFWAEVKLAEKAG
jgi:hypothetical protein